jgi:hypothetical protein
MMDVCIGCRARPQCYCDLVSSTRTKLDCLGRRGRFSRADGSQQGRKWGVERQVTEKTVVYEVWECS